MKMTITGVIAHIGALEAFPNFSKRSLVLFEGGDTERPLPVEFLQRDGASDVLSALASLAPGDLVQCEAVLTAREWQGRHYLRLSGKRIRRACFAETPEGAALEVPSEAAEGQDLPF